MKKMAVLMAILMTAGGCSKSEILQQTDNHTAVDTSYIRTKSDTLTKTCDTACFKPLNKPIIFDVIVDDWE